MGIYVGSWDCDRCYTKDAGVYARTKTSIAPWEFICQKCYDYLDDIESIRNHYTEINW